MKSYHYTLLISFCFFSLISCKKDPETRKVEFNTTVYNALGTFDNTGKPNFLLDPDNISESMMDFINTMIPERVDLRTTHPELLSSNAIADIKITTESDVFVTFVSQHTEYANTFAFYTYPTTTSPATTEDIDTITYVFPNTGDITPLKAGDKVKLGRFTPGTSIGFVLLKDAWKSSSQTINNKAIHFCSNDVLNPEIDENLKKHVVFFDYTPENKTIIGFEDIYRTDPECDHDFNDFVIYCTVTPVI